MVWNSQVPATNKPLVAIGIPHTETITMLWAYRMLGPLLFIPVPFCDKIPQMSRGIPQSVARDQIVSLALADPKTTHILWVDTDNVCWKDPQGKSPSDPNEALNMLLQVNQPIVSGLYRAKQAEGFNYAAWVDAKIPDKPGYTPIQGFQGNFFQVDTIGMGFCLVKREVYEKIPAPWYPWPTVSPSEDFNFCIKARAAGYAINLFTDVKLTHIGSLDVKPDGRVTTLEL